MKNVFSISLLLLASPMLCATTYTWDVIALYATPQWNNTGGATSQANFAYGYMDLKSTGPLIYYSAGQQIPAFSDMPFVFVLNADATYAGGSESSATVGYSFFLWLQLQARDDSGNPVANADPVTTNAKTQLYYGQISAYGFADAQVDVLFASSEGTVVGYADPATNPRVHVADLDSSGPNTVDYSITPAALGSSFFTVYPYQSLIFTGNVTVASLADNPTSGTSYARANDVALVFDLRTYSIPDQPCTALLLLPCLLVAAAGGLRWRVGAHRAR